MRWAASSARSSTHSSRSFLVSVAGSMAGRLADLPGLGVFSSAAASALQLTGAVAGAFVEADFFAFLAGGSVAGVLWEASAWHITCHVSSEKTFTDAVSRLP